MLSEQGQYTFRVVSSASKRHIKDSVERIYGVHVEHVQIVKAHAKSRRRGLTEGIKKGYKKAVVALRKGEAIDIF
ncbi:MAG: 50S ribosomal protein L23 [Candidatus Ryanbacteria bacterium RIFCSPHIGHO2_12_FULL_47_12b]|uniref:50S ribosomal protein L23 n=2 Tax=Candidatus Ryaniibacteriota TaxID=1817914 RepID=A0A1G2H345_9BACT|nr:MAG: 50S ribosomal protein L23 [Candidatus Ryanbacteria bacterium RIFCSPHIGHO2_01_FULL_48_80]OGZ48312.1 MAG: 50S ribosomal protein L23 [Candidatus Ryanbacteria bacterium RIFCSPHIGHO2_02_FULL_47_25]OGZ52236.1 MAG: 50S ribosomal protein L23 [Candidatus Ryanbacteria bacterium RIFCSPLOWO2_01_FULL_47_79]OGZ52885.1 MAG: 50S ribosomal protein L23 [Candidatus Ryanbacteria bacterium RIFCSPHIGHO2_12_FULL_47_12b]OGZ56826.1 MAG: 50S ribosomal protein L23 [Candidatus Ryanbacteria bacterium RIFCSPLOWO2_02